MFSVIQVGMKTRDLWDMWKLIGNPLDIVGDQPQINHHIIRQFTICPK